MFARRLFAGLAGVAGFNAMQGTTAVHANSRSEVDMKDNLARRLAKSYLKSAQFLGDGEAVQMRCRADDSMCAPSLVTVVAATQEMLEVALPDGTVASLPRTDLFSTSLLKNLDYWYSADPEMANTIITYIIRFNKGELML